ncbi:c-type cytochrome [Urbifossiella limnaea]|uniref:Cytochrome c6 n=1 Tax=Urbifossiella limnaea TaxID=2528023 RepID=A0A517XY41_9BACT|nr:c-type cytochrome [Urbifossiella limnaea]QDU22437.1 Cytochrome c6 [Urbifossiella limnaea]
MRRLLLALVAAATAAGCDSPALTVDIAHIADATTARYPVRSDLMPVGDLGAPPRWYSAGAPPLRVLKLDAAAPDAEFVAQLKPKLGRAILDPEKDLTPELRKELAAFLDAAFGTPAAPVVRPVTVKDAEKLKVYEAYTEGRAGKSAAQATEEAATEAAAAVEQLGLTDAALARGAVLYRRWCAECHGPSGAGDGIHAVAGTAMPRDYRRGVFKFVTAFPPGTPRKGELGKPRKDDLRRSITNGLPGSMMPAFAQLTTADIDDLAGYVIHLSVRGEAEFDWMTRMIQLTKNPNEDDPDYSRALGQQTLALRVLLTLGNWGRAEANRIPVPPENTPTPTDRLASAARGFRVFTSTCASCHQNYGRTQQLKFDVWGTVVQPRNLTLGVYRGGRRGEDLYARVYAGIYASTMPDSKAKAGAVPADQPDAIWDAVHFLQALADPRDRMLLGQFDPTIRIE